VKVVIVWDEWICEAVLWCIKKRDEGTVRGDDEEGKKGGEAVPVLN
jgi:hypothetical protein